MYDLNNILETKHLYSGIYVSTIYKNLNSREPS